MKIRDKELQKLLNIAKTHPCCRVIEFDNYVTCQFFEPYSGVESLRVSLGKNKALALTILIRKMDELYNKEFEYSIFHEPLNSLTH
jgi:hypothetical protein